MSDWIRRALTSGTIALLALATAPLLAQDGDDTVAFGSYVLKLNPAILLGALTGAMTSTPALGIVTQAARSSVPALGYAGTYTFANVLLTFAGAVLVSL